MSCRAIDTIRLGHDSNVFDVLVWVSDVVYAVCSILKHLSRSAETPWWGNLILETMCCPAVVHACCASETSEQRSPGFVEHVQLMKSRHLYDVSSLFAVVHACVASETSRKSNPGFLRRATSLQSVCVEEVERDWDEIGTRFSSSGTRLARDSSLRVRDWHDL